MSEFAKISSSTISNFSVFGIKETAASILKELTFFDQHTNINSTQHDLSIVSR